MCSMFLQGKILHFSPQEGNTKSSGRRIGFNRRELMCKTRQWLNFRKLLTAFSALGNSKVQLDWATSPVYLKAGNTLFKEYKTKNPHFFHPIKQAYRSHSGFMKNGICCSRNIQRKNRVLPYPQFYTLSYEIHIASYKKMPTFESTIYTEQPMRTKLSIVKVRDISRNERSFSFYLESIFGVAGHKTALLGKKKVTFSLYFKPFQSGNQLITESTL